MSSPENPHVQNNTMSITDRMGVIALILASVAIGMVIMVPKTYEAKIDAISDKATVAENHWRNLEVNQGVMQSELKTLREQLNAQRTK